MYEYLLKNEILTKNKNKAQLREKKVQEAKKQAKDTLITVWLCVIFTVVILFIGLFL